MSLQGIDPIPLKRRLDDGSIVLVDIREPDEHARESIPGARLVPLSRLDTADFAGSGNRPIVFHCRSGNRTTVNAARLAAKAGGEAYALVGGIAAWKAAGLETRRNRSAPIEIMRQVQIAAGSLVLVGVVLALLVSPWFLALSAFVGGGMTIAGITGFCGMARLLGAMPWNRRSFAH